MTGTNEVVRRQDPLRSRSDFHRLFATSGHIPKAIVATGNMREIVFGRVRLGKQKWLVKHPHFGSGVPAEQVGATLDLSRYPDEIYFEEHVAADANPHVRVVIGKDRKPRGAEAYDLVEDEEGPRLRRTLVDGPVRQDMLLVALRFGRKLGQYRTGDLWLDMLVAGHGDQQRILVCGVRSEPPAARITRS